MKKKYDKNIILGSVSLFILIAIIILSVFALLNRDNLLTVSFDTDGGNNIISQVISNGDLAVVPAKPTKEGYTFIGWQLDKVNYDFSSSVTDSITLIAIWEKENYLINLNDEIEAYEYIEYGTVCWSYSYPLNIEEVYGTNLESFIVSESENVVINTLYSEEVLTLSESEKVDFYISKWSEVSLLHYNLLYDEEKTLDAYNKLLEIEVPENIINFEVNLIDNRITYYYDYMEFSEENEELASLYNNVAIEFEEVINSILGDAFYYGGGCGTTPIFTQLDEKLCELYNLNCDRW